MNSFVSSSEKALIELLRPFSGHDIKIKQTVEWYDKRMAASKHFTGVDRSVRASTNIENFRSDLARFRMALEAIGEGSWFKDQLTPVSGCFTTAMIALHSINEEIIAKEIARDNEEFGEGIKFTPRGIGMDICPGCFVCGATKRHQNANDYLNNIAGFVKSKADGEAVVALFRQGARLDFRQFEPNWIQVKIGACDAHKPNLERLSELVSSAHNIIRSCYIEQAFS